MSDEEDTVTIRGKGSWYHRTLAADQAEEIKQLYEELLDTTTAAAEALGSGHVPSGMALERFYENNARVIEIVERIKAILG